MTNGNPRSDRLQATYDLVTRRLSLIRALYIVSIASNGERSEILAEFHQAVGDIIEGMALSNLNLKHIDVDKVREEASWLQERN